MSLKYRPDIDGLRTIAVCSVLVYHAKFYLQGAPLLRGGFLGVDIFFVISGYLITSLILQEWTRAGQFSIINFYERRARRLLPALFAVIFVSIPAAWFILMPSEMVEFVESVIASVFFVSNMYWQQGLLEYGAGPGLEKPFLHTWSLAVEEQFYIFFPLIYLLALRRISGRIIPVGLAAIALGLAVALLSTHLNWVLSFYWVISRLWELLAGAVLAHLLFHQPDFLRTPKALQILPWVGLLLIIAPLFQTGLLRSHPGLVTVPSVLGTVLLIWFAAPPNPVYRLLSSRIFVGIGLISYSLYLWHYPIFAFGRLLNPENGVLDKVIWLALSFGLAYLSFRFVERPFRATSGLSRRWLIGWIGASTIATMAFATSMILQDGRLSRFPDLLALYGNADFDTRGVQQASWNVLADVAAAKGFGRSHARFASEYEAEHLWFDMNKPGRKVLVLGNSHGKDMFNVFHLNAALFADMQFARFGMKEDLRDDQIDILLDSPNFQAADTVLLAFSTTRQSVRRMPNLIERLSQDGKDIVMLLNSPAFLRKGGRWPFDWYIRDQQGLDDMQGLDALGFAQRDQSLTGKLDQRLTEIALRFGLTVLARADYICDARGKTCDMATSDGRKTIFDRHHYSVAGARYFGQKIHQSGWLRLP